VPVGTLLFDPDGEYFWPDDKGRPGLCDVPALRDQIVVFTSRQAPGAFYQSFVAGNIKLDIRRLKPADVISIALSPEKQDQQNVRKLKGLDTSRWSRLVDLIHKDGNNADEEELARLVGLKEDQQAELLAARANMTVVVRMLHDPGSQLMDMLLEALTEGKLCVIDVSQLRGGPSLVLSGLILRRIFDRNQEEFTKAEPRTIPTIAVVEEAQSVLNPEASGADPYLAWVKEGRKYDLGAVLITQQPGSIPHEILSQGDNWFVFHLLSSGDLQSLRKANAHFSEDLLATLLNEPITGQGVFWSSVGGKPYPLPVRIFPFETMYPRAEGSYDQPAVSNYAARLRAKYARELEEARTQAPAPEAPQSADDEPDSPDSESIDSLEIFKQRAIQRLDASEEFRRSISRPGGFPWGAVVGILEAALPESMQDRNRVAYDLVAQAVSQILGGEQDVAWKTEKRLNRNNKTTTFIVRIPQGA
jgi:hypothetical protein